MEEFDLAVIGAGFAGLATAKTWAQLNEGSSLVVLDGAESIGGVWATERLYPGLKTNNMQGQYEYPDFPMDPAVFGVKPGEHIPGHVCHAYLQAYADKFAVASKIRLRTRVVSAEHRGDVGGWIVTTAHEGAEQRQMVAKHLAVATGLTSEPFLPIISGQESFGGPIFHARHFAAHAGTVDTAKSVAVLGGTKSAWDAVYAYAAKGVHVDWVIRESGHGPIWISPPYVTPLGLWLEKLVHTRVLTWFSPCVWGYADGYSAIRNFWHGTAVGRKVTDLFWRVLGNDVLSLQRYDSHPETAKLKPWSNAFFVGSSFSIMNYDVDFFAYVRSGLVKVHIADVTHLSDHTVHLSNNTTLQSDAICAVTGWKHVPPLRFLPEGIDARLGIPHIRTQADHDQAHELLQRVDADILAQFPRLRNQPKPYAKYVPLTNQQGITTHDVVTPYNQDLTPYTLYRFVAPSDPALLRHHDIAFPGVHMNFTTAVIDHVQALWINAYFHGHKSVMPSCDTDADRDKLRYQTVLHSRFGRWRYPAARGETFPDFVFDAIPYVDLLLRDLGLNPYRKGGRLAEMFKPYGPSDWKDTVDEWRLKNEGKLIP